MNSILEDVKKYLEQNDIVQALESLQICAFENRDNELIRWTKLELSGFYDLSENEMVPEYRVVAGAYFDTFGRQLQLTQETAFLSESRLRYPISQIIDLSNEGHSILKITDPILLSEINKGLGVQVSNYQFSASHLKKIISHVRLECKKYLLKLQNIQRNDIFEISNSTMFTNLHPKIKSASEKLFLDGHFRQAILDSYIVLVNEVKNKSGNSKDGSSLMQSVFSKDNPILKISDDNDEQLGFMWLFSGAVMGIRNPKAHKIIPQNCPHRTYEWLAFASVLMKVLDSSTKIV